MFTGLLAGALEGAAKGTVDVADDIIKSNERANARLLDNAEHDRRLRMAMDIKLKQELETERNNAANFERSRTAAEQVGDARRFDKFKNDVGQSSADDQALKQVFDRYYNNKVAGPGDDGKRYVERGSVLEKDTLDQMLRNGASGESIRGQRGLLDSARKDERSQDDAELKERREDRRERESAAKMEKMAGDLEVARQRADDYGRSVDKRGAGKGGSGRGTDPAKNEIARAREERLQLKGDRDTVLKQLDAGLIKKDEARTRLAEINAMDSRLKKVEDGAADTQPAKAAKPSQKPQSVMSSLPPGAKQIGTSGGKPVYQTPDGKKFIAD